MDGQFRSQKSIRSNILPFSLVCVWVCVCVCYGQEDNHMIKILRPLFMAITPLSLVFLSEDCMFRMKQ